MLETTIAGSLPKPSWLAEPKKLWPAWRLEADALAEVSAAVSPATSGRRSSFPTPLHHTP